MLTGKKSWLCAISRGTRLAAASQYSNGMATRTTVREPESRHGGI